MAKLNPTQQRVVGRVMHEFKQGDLPKGDGKPVRNPRQAIAIALSEAGASNRQSSAKNRQRLHHTVAQGGARKPEPTRAVLYEQAQHAGLAGRSRMSKAELQRALAKH